MKTHYLSVILALLATLLFASCSPRATVGALQTESQAVELGDATSAQVKINFPAGNLEISGGAEALLEADFTYNVAKLKPEVQFTGGTLVVGAPEIKGLPALTGITDFRNEWDLRLNDEVPLNLSVEMGAGTGDLHLAGLSLAGLDVSLGAGTSTVDLSGDWARDLNVTIDSGAAEVTVRLPSQTGVRVEVETGPVMVVASGLTKEGNVYTNAAYGMSEVTLQIDMEAGVGRISLEVD